MRRLLLLFLPLVTLLCGCGKKLSGRYEAVPDVPRMAMPKGVDPKVQRQMDDALRKTQDLTRMSLEFDGSTVKMGTAYAIHEYKYRIDGQKLEVISEAMGQKTTVPMTIEADGSISYMGMTYRKVQ